jgi:hypothetical protein
MCGNRTNAGRSLCQTCYEIYRILPIVEVGMVLSDASERDLDMDIEEIRRRAFRGF